MYIVKLMVDPVNYRWSAETLREAIAIAKLMLSATKFVNNEQSACAPKVTVWAANGENITSHLDI